MKQHNADSRRIERLIKRGVLVERNGEWVPSGLHVGRNWQQKLYKSGTPSKRAKKVRRKIAARSRRINRLGGAR